MGLKQDLIKAKVQGLKASPTYNPSIQIDTSTGSMIEREAHYMSRAIINALVDANFRVTQLNAPVVLEDIKTPDLPVNVELETLLGEYKPVLKMLRKLGDPLGLGGLIEKLEDEIAAAITPLLEGGSTLPGLDLAKRGDRDDDDGSINYLNRIGALESTGYVYIGEDPDSQDQFDVSDEDGQRQHTTVKLLEDDARKLL